MVSPAIASSRPCKYFIIWNCNKTSEIQQKILNFTNSHSCWELLISKTKLNIFDYQVISILISKYNRAFKELALARIEKSGFHLKAPKMNCNLYSKSHLQINSF